MKNPNERAPMAAPLPLLLALLLMVSVFSCSHPDLADIVREYVAAVTNDDIEKNLTLFTDAGVFEPDAATKLSGKAQVRNLMEWDVANNARLSIISLRVEGDTVIAELTEKNEGWRLLGIDIPFTATYKFRGRRIRRVKCEFSPESWKIFEDAFNPFAEWAKRAHPGEYQRMSEAGYSAEGARLFLSLAKEWRDKTETEKVSGEQARAKLPVKVLVLTMFEVDKNTGDSAGEFQHWYEAYFAKAKSYGVKGFMNPLYLNDRGVAGWLTGMGKAQAASTLAAILSDVRFDFSCAYILVSGCAVSEGASALFHFWGDFGTHLNQPSRCAGNLPPSSSGEHGPLRTLLPEPCARTSARRQPSGLNFEMLTSAQ
jgi:limonene-1,2-epoxide hydrolase